MAADTASHPGRVWLFSELAGVQQFSQCAVCCRLQMCSSNKLICNSNQTHPLHSMAYKRAKGKSAVRLAAFPPDLAVV